MIYVLCPADVKTGGTELLHQLVKTLTDVKVPAGIVYTEISEEHPGMNPAFLEYTDGYLREEEIEDEKGNILVEPIIYSDRRSTEEAEIIKAAVGVEKLFDITANNCMTGAHSGTSMLWIKRNLPEIYEKTKYFGHINTVLAQKMTGNFAIDYSNASYTNLFETQKGHKGQWSDYLCETIGIAKEKLPKYRVKLK